MMGQLSYTWVLCASANIPGLPVYCNRAPLVLHPTYAESCNHPHPHDPMAPRHICWSLPAIPMLLSTFVIRRTFCTDYWYPCACLVIPMIPWHRGIFFDHSLLYLCSSQHLSSAEPSAPTTGIPGPIGRPIVIDYRYP